MVDEQKIADRKLSKELKDDFRAKNKIIKLLLLGTGKVDIKEPYGGVEVVFTLERSVLLWILLIIVFTEGESGKSTIVKQMKIINNKETNNEDGYPEGEKKNQIGIIRKNVLDSIEQFLLGRASLGKNIFFFSKPNNIKDCLV